MRHILIAIFALAVAADISGQWKGEFGGQNGTREIVFQFKADGARLTGTVSGLRDKQLNIEDGMLQGEEVSFYVNSEWRAIR